MSETVKLIIEIPKETYLELKSGFITRNAMVSAEAIKNGIPLDDVKAEISNIDSYERDGYWVMADVLKVLHNIGKGDKE